MAQSTRFPRALAFVLLGVLGAETIEDAAADNHCPRPPGVPPGARYSCPTHTQTYQPKEPIIRHPGGSPGRGREARDPAQQQTQQQSQTPQPPGSSSGGVPFLELPAQAAERADDFSQYGLGNVQCVDLAKSKFIADLLMQEERDYNCFFYAKAWIQREVPRRGLTGGSAMLTDQQLSGAGYRELGAKPRITDFFAKTGDVVMVEGTQTGVLKGYPYTHAAIVLATTPEGRIRTLRQKFSEDKCVVDLDTTQFSRVYGVSAGQSYRLWRKY
jgi:hypothetical protein